MSRFPTFHFFILLLLCFTSCYKERVVFDAEPNSSLELPLILKINNKNCSFDSNSKTLRYPIDNESIESFGCLIEFQDYSNIYFKGSLLENNTINNLGDIEVNKDYDLLVITNNTTRELKLKFTRLPIIQIITHNEIVDEPKKIARLIINYPETAENVITSYVGIEFRGETSQSFPKKSMSFSFLNSTFTNDETSKSIFNLPQNSDWGLDAMYVDKSRLRNKTSFDLWKHIQGDRNHSVHYYFVELYINSEHQGLYCIHELVNSEFLNLVDNDAVLYKAIDWTGTLFDFYSEDVSSNKHWDGWEQKFPEDAINWEPLANLRSSVVNDSDFDFSTKIEELINLDNVIDYYLFINLISVSDNVGKNNYLTRESDHESLCIIPWDLDGSLGIMWNGDYVSYTNILSNNLFDRLISVNPNGFKYKLKDRWLNLRMKCLSTDKILSTLEFNFNTIYESDVQQIENHRWGGDVDFLEESQYINNWIINRVSFLDDYYMNL